MNIPATIDLERGAVSVRELYASKIEAIGVVIRARNQAETIAQCILSIFAANHRAGWQKSLWIIVVADACMDKTVKVARDAVGAFGRVLAVDVASSRTAREIGAGAVFEHFHNKPRHAILLANADANTCMRRDWIDIQLKRHVTDVESIAHPTTVRLPREALLQRLARTDKCGHLTRSEVSLGQARMDIPRTG